MSTEKLKLEVLLAAIDKITKPLKAIQSGSSETAKALKSAKDRLKELNEEQKRVDGFRAAAKGIAIHRQELAKAEERVRTITQAMKASAYPTRDMQKAFKEATEEAKRLKGNITQLTEKQERHRRALSASGADTHKLASYQRTLKSQMSTATAEVEKQSKALEVMGQRNKSLRAARYGYQKTLDMRHRMESAGMATLATGAAVGLPIVKAVRDYASYEDAMLGVARQVEGARDDNGKLTQTYYDMGEAIKAMAEQIPLATTKIAAIIEAGARMGIKGKENLLTYARTTAVMATAFDLPVEQVGENVAKISQLYKIPIKDIKALGDTINWLDDNALSKGGEIIDVMQRIAGSASLVNMNFKEAAALGSTFLSLGASAEIAATASNAMIGQIANAPMLATAKRYLEGLEMLKLNAKDLQLGMNKDATGTILRVLGAIKALPKEQQLEAATRLFGKEYGDDASKLAENLDEYRRQLKLVNEERARGSMQREADARNQVLSAQYEMMKNAVFNLTSALGEKLKPALVEIMQSGADALRWMRDFVAAYHALTAALLKGAAVIAIIVTALGALMITIAAVLGPIAVLKYGMALLGIKGAVVITVIKSIGTAILWLGRALLMNPLGLAVTLLATAAFLIYKNWAPIKDFFIGLWNGITAGFISMVNFFTEKLSFMKPLLNLLPTSAKLAITAAMAMGGTAQAQPVKFDTRPPITAPSAIAAHAGQTQNSIVIHAAPGMNEQHVADLVARKLDERDREKAARSRSRLTDKE